MVELGGAQDRDELQDAARRGALAISIHHDANNTLSSFGTIGYFFEKSREAKKVGLKYERISRILRDFAHVRNILREHLGSARQKEMLERQNIHPDDKFFAEVSPYGAPFVRRLGSHFGIFHERILALQKAEKEKKLPEIVKKVSNAYVELKRTLENAPSRKLDMPLAGAIATKVDAMRENLDKTRPYGLSANETSEKIRSELDRIRRTLGLVTSGSSGASIMPSTLSRQLVKLSGPMEALENLPGKRREFIDEMLKTHGNIELLINNFENAYGKKQVSEPSEINLAAELRGIRERLSLEASFFQISASGDLPKIRMNATDLFQIVQNIHHNAKKAGASILRINLSKREMKGKPWVQMQISDDGPGIPEHLLKGRKLFELFHTGGSGSGIGLKTVELLVQNHGGKIDARNNAGKKFNGGKGATFTIRLPVDGAARRSRVIPR